MPSSGGSEVSHLVSARRHPLKNTQTQFLPFESQVVTEQHISSFPFDASRVAVVSRFLVVETSLGLGLFKVFLFYLPTLGFQLSPGGT